MIRRTRFLPALLCAGLLAAAPAPASSQAPSTLVQQAPPSVAVLQLRDRIGEILHAPGWRDARFGVLVVSLDRGDTLFALHPDEPLEPASNMKLYSTAAALHFLGPDYRFSTYLLADGPVRDGVLQGDLVLYGTGDPTISGRMLPSTTSTFEAFADTLAARGVREVSGDVVGDGSYFSGPRLGPAWLDEDLDEWYAAPEEGLGYAENMVTVHVAPGATGDPARITTEPATRGLALENRVRTVAHGATRVHIERAADRLVVEGQVRRRTRGVTRSIPVVDPTNYAAAGLRAILEERGIRVLGATRAVHDAGESVVGFAGAPGKRSRTVPVVVAVHRSPTLAEIVSVTNHVSHNLFAEALLRAAGRAAAGEGDLSGGAHVVRAFLATSTTADSAALHQVDGSGLSTLNHLTPRTTVQLLDAMAHSGVWDAYFASLPEAGDPHGMHRMEGTPAAGRLRAKTGTIHGVSALSGYVTDADGERLLFSIMANGVPSTWREKRSEDAIGAALAGFKR